MEIVGEQELKSVLSGGKVGPRRCFDVRKGNAHRVRDFMDLATKVAALHFNNPEYVLLYRGQRIDHRRHSSNEEITSLAPQLFRGENGNNPSSATLDRRFWQLKRAEEQLIEAYRREGLPDLERLKRQQILRWSILQHYQVCPTPLLDVTQSLRIAASFASDGAEGKAFVFVLGVPHLSGAITASADAGIQIVRLSSVCPPEAVRPHIQEGYLLGEYPELRELDQKQNYRHFEIDFGRRLVAKFWFNPKSFWDSNDAFPRVERPALYPNANDPLYKLAKAVERTIARN